MAILDDTTLTFEFSASSWKEPFKSAVGIRTFPLDAINDVAYNVPGSVRSGSMSVRVKPGRDPLREFLKDDNPSARADPDCLVIAPAQAAQTELFVTRIRDAVAQAATSRARVATGRLPMDLKGSDGAASFDGHHLYLEFGGWTTDPAKKSLGRRTIPVSAIQGVQVRHPGMSGWIRFVPVDGPIQANLPPARDPHTLCLNADAARRYVILAAAITERLPQPANRDAPVAIASTRQVSSPVPAAANRASTLAKPAAGQLLYGLPDTVDLGAEGRLVQASGLKLIRFASLGSKVGIVGESHYQKALRKIAGGKAVPAGSFDDAIPAVAVLVPEPHNPHDSSAVRVDLLDGQGFARPVGHLDRFWAAECHDRLASLNGYFGYCQARIMGGGRGRHYGVFLHWHPNLVEPVANRLDSGYLLEGDRRITVTKEESHQDVLSRYAPNHVDGRTIVLADLAFSQVRSGKYTGEKTIEVRFGGQRIGETTRNQAQKYEALIHSVLDVGASAVCESIVRRKVGQLEVQLLLPSRF